MKMKMNKIIIIIIPKNMKENEKDYNHVISEEIRGIHVDEVNGILKKLCAICKILN